MHIGNCTTRTTTKIFQIYFLDFCEEAGSKEDGYPALRHLEEQWMVQMGSLGALDPVQGWNKRDDAKASARNWGT